METTLYNQSGKSAGTIKLPESIFGLTWNADLMHQVVTGMQSNKRAGTADARGRGEVRGGGKKPWKQKGTGQARHGSIRSPIWKGGGVTHGPLAEKNYNKKINQKMKTKALYVALSEKLRAGKILFVEDIKLAGIKTKDAAKIMKSLSSVEGFTTLGGTRRVGLLSLGTVNTTTEKSFQNLPQIDVDTFRNLNPLDVMSYRYLIITNPTEAVSFLESKMKPTVKKAK